MTTTTSNTFVDLLNLACGHRATGAGDTPARRAQLIVGSILGALVLASMWGLAAGSGAVSLALANTFKVPLILLLSMLCALPAGLLALKLTGTDYRSSDLIMSYASGVFGGALVLAVLAPLVAIYYHTSAMVGSKLAIASVFAAIAVATLLFVRNVARRAITGCGGLVFVPVAVLLILQVASMVQFVALASPILPDPSAFDGGVDSLFYR